MTTPAPKTTTTQQADENHLKTVEQLPFDSAATTTTCTNKPPASTSNSDETKSTTGNPVTVTVNNGQNDGDSVQKKIRRAERFGMPVQLSELEKRNSRAHRLYTNTNTNSRVSFLLKSYGLYINIKIKVRCNDSTIKFVMKCAGVLNFI